MRRNLKFSWLYKFSDRLHGKQENYFLGLLVFVPISIAANFRVGFTYSLHHISYSYSLGGLVEHCYEEVAVVTGPSIGALLNAVFGNATELIIALV